MKFRPLYFAISLALLIPGILSLMVWGLQPAIDFTGGSLLEIKGIESQLDQSKEDLLEADGEEVAQELEAEIKASEDQNQEGEIKGEEELEAELGEVELTDVNKTQHEFQEVIGELYELSSVQSSGENQVILRGKEIDNETKDQVLTQIKESWGEVEEMRFETVGPVLGQELLTKTLIAIVLVSVMITLYVWRQFNELKYGVCAILAMFHDSLILLGAFSLLGHFYGIEVDVLFVTALLTTLSFSIHDTIVVFDRIRELKRKHGKLQLTTVVNLAVIETLSRSINNSVTIILMLLALVLVGGESIRWFSVALLIGAVTGTYSSTFTAAPLLLAWEDVGKWMKARKKRK